MSAAGAVLTELDRRGIRVEARGERLALSGPTRGLPADLRAAVVRLRPALVAILAPTRARCASCNDAPPILMAMEPGPDGAPWSLCRRCWL